MSLDAMRTVRELAIEIPNATRTFEKLGIDYCCGGTKSLRDACAQAHIPLDEVINALAEANAADQHTSADAIDPNTVSLRELIDHIVARHHTYVKLELPRIGQLLAKVVHVHGDGHAELAVIQETFQAISGEMSSHLMKEENILFPYIADLENARNSGRPAPRAMFGSLAQPVHMMEMEHDSAGTAMKEIARLSNNYQAPEGACFSYKTLYSTLQAFESDLHQHVHLENNVLFPRAIAMEENKRAVNV